MEQANDWRNEVVIDGQLERSYQESLAAGDVRKARSVAGEIKARRASGERRAARTVAQIEAVRPRRPRAGEESKLAKRQQALGRRIAALEKKKSSVLAGLLDTPEADFQQAHAIDGDLSNAQYELQAVEERLSQIAAWHDAQAAEKRQREQFAARQKAEAERQRTVAALDKLAKETAEHWRAVVGNLASIKAKARQLDERPDRWLQSILEATGAVETLGPVAGLPAGCWLFPVPEGK
jgi:hypothetical protein